MPAPATARVLATRETLADHGASATARISAEHDARRRLSARRMRVGDVDGALRAGRPCARLGADRDRGGRHAASSSRAITSARRTRPACPSRSCPATSSSPRRPSACRCSAIPTPASEVAQAPRIRRAVSRARPYRRRLCARQGAAGHGAAARGRLRPADLPARRHGAADRALQERGHPARRDAEGRGSRAREARRAPSCCARPRRSRTSGRANSPIPSPASPRAGCGSGPGPGRRASNCRSSSRTIPTGTSSARTILETGAGEVWVTHGQEDALVHWCTGRGIKRQAPAHARLRRRRRGRTDEGRPRPEAEDRARPRHEPLRRISSTASSTSRAATPSSACWWITSGIRPIRTGAMRSRRMTGALMFREAKPGLIRGLVEERVDPVLFRMSYHYVGDLAETVALIWPGPQAEGRGRGRRRRIGHNNPPPHVPTLTEVVETLATTGKSELPARLAGWLDALDETGRWALLKLITGELRVGVSARLAKTAVAQLGGHRARRGRADLARARAALRGPVRLGRGRGPSSPESEQPGPVPSADALASAGGRGFRQARCRPISRRVEMGRHPPPGRRRPGRRRARRSRRIYSRTGEDVSPRLPRSRRGADLRGRHRRRVADRARRPRAELQRAAAAPEPEGGDAQAAATSSRPICASTTSWRRATRTCAPCPSPSAARLEALVARLDDPRIDLSPLVPFAILGGAGGRPGRSGLGRAPGRTPMPSRAA